MIGDLLFTCIALYGAYRLGRRRGLKAGRSKGYREGAKFIRSIELGSARLDSQRVRAPWQ